jgi:predicted PurR-regulated permease PerM
MRIIDDPRERAQVLVIALGLAILIAVLPFAAGLLGAAVLCVVFAPIHRWLSRFLPPRVAAGITLLIAAVAILIPGALLAMIVIDRTPQALATLQQSTIFTRLATLRIAGLDVGAYVVRMGDDALAWLSPRVFAMFGSAVQATLNLVVAFFGLYYSLIAAPQTWVRLEQYVPFTSASTEALQVRFRLVTEAMLLGIALTAALQGLVVGFGFWLVELPQPLFWGLITAFVSVLPVLGSALVWLPGAIVLAAGGRYGAALALVAIGAGVASNIDNVIRPMVYRRVSHIHPMTTVVGAFAGVAQFGVIGVLLGPLAISYFFELLRMYRQEYGTLRGAVPTSTGDGTMVATSEPGALAT